VSWPKWPATFQTHRPNAKLAGFWPDAVGFENPWLQAIYLISVEN